MYRIIVLGSEVDLYAAIYVHGYTIYRTHHIKGMTSQVYFLCGSVVEKNSTNCLLPYCYGRIYKYYLTIKDSRSNTLFVH